MRLLRKLRCHRGETLVETLIAVLIIALSTTVLASMITASSRAGTRTREMDEQFLRASDTAEEILRRGGNLAGVDVSMSPTGGVITVRLEDGEAALVAYRPEREAGG